MPELPDVEVLGRYLKSTSLHQKIESVEVRNEKVLGGTSSQKLRRALRGRRLESARRHGKYLFVELDGGAAGGWLVMHFGMTGSLEYFASPDREPAHARVLLTFENGYRLAFEDQRMLGKVDLAREPEGLISDEDLGPDALDLDSTGFRERLRGKRGAIKPALMDQRLLAGVGNIYADEILFQARIHPGRKAADLSDADLDALSDKTRTVLSQAIERGADPNRLPEDWLLLHRQEGERCPGCGGEVRKIKVSGRGGYYCPACQPETDSGCSKTSPQRSVPGR